MSDAPTSSARLQFGQAVDGSPEQFGSRVDEPVPALVGGRVPEAEVRAEVDDEGHDPGELRDDRLRPPGRYGDEDDVATGERRRVGRRRDKAGVGPAEAREQLGDRRPGRGLRLGGNDIEIGMGRQQPQQLGTEIARRPDDRRLHGMTILTVV